MMAAVIPASTWEALLLGLATGPVCLASCGPVVVPWMVAQTGGGFRIGARRLGTFLVARLAGYLMFACAAWTIGSLIPRRWAGCPCILRMDTSFSCRSAGLLRRRLAAPEMQGNWSAG